MAWTGTPTPAEIMNGPFRIGYGAADSEVDIGETRELALTVEYNISEIGAGDLLGPETLINATVRGIRVMATFIALETDSTNLDALCPLATLSTGPASKSLTLDAATIGGADLYDSAARWVFHKHSNSTMTDLEEDFVFPKAIVIPSGEIDLSGEDAAGIPCTLYAFVEATTSDIMVYSKDATG